MIAPFWVLFLLGLVVEGLIIAVILDPSLAGFTGFGGGLLFHFYRLIILRRQHWKEHPRNT